MVVVAVTLLIRLLLVWSNTDEDLSKISHTEVFNGVSKS